MNEIRRTLSRIIAKSLNSEQINFIAQSIDGGFDLAKLSGFGKNIAIPSSAATETIINHFRQEDELILFFETMMNREGKFLFNATLVLKDKEVLISLLRKKKWIYDEDCQLFFRDPFFVDEINFLKSISFMDLRNNIDTEEIINNIKINSEKLMAVDIEWFITMRLYGFTSEINTLIRTMLDLLLTKQNLTQFTSEFYFCLRELAINAGKAGYKVLFEEYVREQRSATWDYSYQEMLNLFKEEIESNRDDNLIQLARQKDKYFDIFFKSGRHSISIWATNYTKISKIEKIRLLDKLNLNPFHEEQFGSDADDFSEGAGMGIFMVLNILKKIYHGKDPLKIAFYPDRTKIGFLIFRSDLIKIKNERESD